MTDPWPEPPPQCADCGAIQQPADRPRWGIRPAWDPDQQTIVIDAHLCPDCLAHPR